jgi:dolichyl-phosphate beta-glucosyltransferase
MDTLSIIIPAYNEASRLPRTFELLSNAIEAGVFSSLKLVEILVVDDGSSDQTIAITKAEIDKGHPLAFLLRVIAVSPNAGKGNAIHTGLLRTSADWCLVADADSATPWDQFTKLQIATHKVPIAIGSRDLPESDVRTRQSWIREHMGKTFNLFVRLITGLPFNDTQCGFKLIRHSAVVPFLAILRVKRFAWDVEFLMLAKEFGVAVKEVPVAWEHQDASHVDPIKDASEMLARVIQLRLRLLFCKK